MVNSINDIIDYIKANGISDEDWHIMYDEAIKFDKNRSEEEKHQRLLSDIRKLDSLYKSDKHFQMWCLKLKEMEEYQCALEDFDISYAKTHGGSYHPEWSDAPGEDIYIPCFTHDSIKNSGNPYNYSTSVSQIIYVRKDVDDIIIDESKESGSKAFAAFWAYNFDTTHMPEIVYNEYHSGSDRSPSCMEDYDFESNDEIIFYKRELLYDHTLWGDRSSLKDLYKEAISG